jgi:hypothetical protein
MLHYVSFKYKKMKKYIITIIAFCTAALMFSSCKKAFLDEKVYSSYSASSVTDSLGFEAALVGLYYQTSTFYTYSDNQGWPSVWQVGTDIANGGAGQVQGIEVPYYNYASLTSTDYGAYYTWQWAYKLINNANLIIANVEGPNATGVTNKKIISAEARFFRAYAYNILATAFGRVPIITAPLTAPKTDFVRAPLADVNNLIVTDLTFASANLADVGPVNTKLNSAGKPAGRANKYMAMQLLAEAYLRMGKPDLAEVQAQAVISSNKFSLVNSRYGVHLGQPGDYYSDMFVYGNQRRSQGNTEAIWVLEEENPTTVPGGITNSPQQRRVWGAAYYQLNGMAICDSLGGRGIARLRLSNWVLYGLYPANDMRNSKYNIRRQFYYNDPTKPALFGKPVPYVGTDTLIRLAPHTTKWYQYDPNDAFGFAMIKDFILMRLGETYLLLAEAQVQQGKTAQAAATINVLRARANAPTVTAAQMTLDFVLDERVRELVGEENRRLTLMRTGTLVSRATRLNSGSAFNPITGISNTNLLLPIPQSEIDLNKDAVLDQNPGY